MGVIQRYRLTRLWRVFFTLLVAAPFFGAFAIVVLTIRDPPKDEWQATLHAVEIAGLVLFAGVMTRVAFQHHIEFGAGYLRVSGLGGPSFSLSDIVGWQLGRATTPATYVFVKRDGSRVPVPAMFEFDARYFEWLDSIPNIDVQSEVEQLRTIAADDRLGGTQEDRLLLLERVRNECRWINRVGWVLGLWAFVFPTPYLPLMTCLLVSPWFALAYAWSRRGLVQFDELPGDARPSLASLALFQPICLATRALLDFDVVAPRLAVLGPALAIGGILGMLAAFVDASPRRTALSRSLGLVVALVYGWAAVVSVNCLLDTRDAPRIDRARVLGRHIVAGKARRYVLEIRGYGEHDVARHVYDAAAPGTEVCAAVHPGALGLEWLGIDTCSNCCPQESSAK
ncbi:MAG: hypothetical protein K1Y01_01180 [Vicinamibacteria bacterium]|nr:hypothetical protein [Vicinamibacteria bacterium]